MHKIVILGGGFGGLRVALELEKRCARMGECEILLIDRQSEHLYTPLLYEVATGFLEERGSVCRGSLREGVCIRFEQFRTIIGSKQIHVRRAEITAVDPAKKAVALATGEEIGYDDLVIALGSEARYYDIPGLRPHSFAFKTLHDAFAIRERLHAYLDKYRQGEVQKIQLVIGGAGATGVELACEAANFFRELQKKEVIRKEGWAVSLVDAAPSILTSFSSDLRERAQQRLRALGVRVLCKAEMKEATATSVILHVNGQKVVVPSEVTVWCGGITPAGLLAKIDLPKSSEGYVEVDATFRLQGMNNIYALGDCVHVLSDRGPFPALAQVALAEASAIAENLVRQVEGRALVAWSPSQRWSPILPLGGSYAVGKIGPLCLWGKAGYLLRKIVDLRYWLQTLPLKEALEVWLRGAKTYLKND